MIRTLLHIDKLNTLLIIISLVIAILFPFELFLVAYAILGPLHYLTEINWIKENNYFFSKKYWVGLVILFSFLVSAPVVLKLSFFQRLNSDFVNYIEAFLSSFSNQLIFLVLVIVFVHLFIADSIKRYIAIVLAILLAFLIKDLSIFNIWIGIFLPTIVHVYFFTLLFMWYGAIKAKSQIGYFNVLLLCLIPLIITVLPTDAVQYKFSSVVQNTITDNKFHLLNTNISKLLGFSDGTSFYFNGIIDLKIQIMIAFAYTYHYLNWFSKTTVIGWYKIINTKIAIIITLIWLLSIAIYYYDYKIGLALLLFLSLLHVFMEFPLNFISIREIGKSLRQFLQKLI